MKETRKLRITTEIVVEAIDTDTVGYYDFLVATLCGGVPEDPEFHYEDYQIIHADSKEGAEELYNKINNCNYYYGEVVGRINMYGIVVPILGGG